MTSLPDRARAARQQVSMHICFNALDYPSHSGGSGVGNQVRLLGQALVQAGHRVTVIALAQKGLPAFSEDEGVRVHRVHCGNLHWYLSRIPLVGSLLTLPVRELERGWTTCRTVARLHQSEPFDVIEGTETGMFWIPRRLPAIPFVIRLHGEPYTVCKYTPGMRPTAGLRLSRLLQRMPLRRARLLVSPSQAHAREIGQELGRVRPPIDVVPNTLSPAMVGAGAATRVPEWCGIKGRVVLYVGRLERGKGVLTLLEAAHRVLAVVPDAHFVLAGPSHPTLARQKLTAAIQGLPGKDRLHFLGHVPWSDLFGWYRGAAVCVLPSYYETFGLAALEPMAFGVPVISTWTGGLPEVVDDEVSGLLVPSGDAAALARQIIRLLGDSELSRRLGEGGRKRVTERFQLAEHVRTNLALLGWAAGNPKAPGPREHVFFSPHLDDAVLSCGGLVHAARHRGKR